MNERRSETLRKTSLGGSMLAAITASLCCIGPLAAIALGASGFAAARFFEKSRPYLLTATVSLLGLAWFLTYRKPKPRCDNGSCSTKSIFHWNKVILWAATAVVFVSAAFPNLSSTFLRNESTTTDSANLSDANVLEAKIPSMDCAACAAIIEKTLSRQYGVWQAHVDFDSKKAVVYYHAGKISGEKIIETINKTGFKAEPLRNAKEL